MSEKHLCLAKKFNEFAYELVSKETTIKGNLTSLKDDSLFRRVIFQKYYYALYHKYLAHDDELSSKTGSGKHGAIKSKIEKCRDEKLSQVFIKLQNLRVWADYEYSDQDKALKVNLKEINSNVWSIIKRSNINC
ncbi:MAG: hypothetical protein JJV94_01350 [Sulfurospirillum sp.]|nr:hypothetical protein [Sulfurospirillum sp.]